jgi:hypothetical protein
LSAVPQCPRLRADGGDPRDRTTRSPGPNKPARATGGHTKTSPGDQRRWVGIADRKRGNAGGVPAGAFLRIDVAIGQCAVGGKPASTRCQLRLYRPFRQCTGTPLLRTRIASTRTTTCTAIAANVLCSLHALALCESRFNQFSLRTIAKKP